MSKTNNCRHISTRYIHARYKRTHMYMYIYVCLYIKCNMYIMYYVRIHTQYNRTPHIVTGFCVSESILSYTDVTPYLWATPCLFILFSFWFLLVSIMCAHFTQYTHCSSAVPVSLLTSSNSRANAYTLQMPMVLCCQECASYSIIVLTAR